MPRTEYRPSRARPEPSRPAYPPPSREKSKRAALVFYRILMALTLFLILVILGGTLYALVLRPKPAASGPPRSEASSAPAKGGLPTEAAMFTALGRLRCPAAGGAVILQAVFPYYPGDRPFSEELVSRIRDFRNLTLDYFAALSAEELARIPESTVKAELLSRYNALLRLGQIETLYFNEFLIIE